MVGGVPGTPGIPGKSGAAASVPGVGHAGGGVGAAGGGVSPPLGVGKEGGWSDISVGSALQHDSLGDFVAHGLAQLVGEEEHEGHQNDDETSECSDDRDDRKCSWNGPPDG